MFAMIAIGTGETIDVREDGGCVLLDLPAINDKGVVDGMQSTNLAAAEAARLGQALVMIADAAAES